MRLRHSPASGVAAESRKHILEIEVTVRSWEPSGTSSGIPPKRKRPETYGGEAIRECFLKEMVKKKIPSSKSEFYIVTVARQMKFYVP